MRRIPAAELNFFAYRVSLMYGLPLPKLFKMILISKKKHEDNIIIVVYLTLLRQNVT